MRKRKNKFIALLLSAVLMATLLPMSAMADVDLNPGLELEAGLELEGLDEGVDAVQALMQMDADSGEYEGSGSLNVEVDYHGFDDRHLFFPSIDPGDEPPTDYRKVTLTNNGDEDVWLINIWSSPESEETDAFAFIVDIDGQILLGDVFNLNDTDWWLNYIEAPDAIIINPGDSLDILFKINPSLDTSERTSHRHFFGIVYGIDFDAPDTANFHLRFDVGEFDDVEDIHYSFTVNDIIYFKINDPTPISFEITNDGDGPVTITEYKWNFAKVRETVGGKTIYGGDRYPHPDWPDPDAPGPFPGDVFAIDESQLPQTINPGESIFVEIWPVQLDYFGFHYGMVNIYWEIDGHCADVGAHVWVLYGQTEGEYVPPTIDVPSTIYVGDIFNDLIYSAPGQIMWDDVVFEWNKTLYGDEELIEWVEISEHEWVRKALRPGVVEVVYGYGPHIYEETRRTITILAERPSPSPSPSPSVSPPPSPSPSPSPTPSPSPSASPIPDTVITNILTDPTPTITIQPGQGTIISQNSLQALKENDVPLTVNHPSGAVLTIDPASITDDAKAIDLNMGIVLTSQATEIVTETGIVKVPANSIAIIPNTHGSFGFDVSITFTAAQLVAAGVNGNSVRLFYINEAGEAIDMGRARLNPDGSVTVVINHASFYILSDEVPAGYRLAMSDYTVNVFSRLNVRRAPNTRSPIAGKLRRGDVVKVLNIVDGWAQIAYTDETPIAYVSARFLRKK